MQRINEFLFEALLFAVSAAILVLMLFGCISLRRTEDEISRLQQQIEETRYENRLLSSQCDNVMSLEELESYAVNVLGMQQPRPWQIVYTELSEPDPG